MGMLAKDKKDNEYTPIAYAHRLRRILAQWCMRDFGIRSRVRKVSNLFEIAELTDEDKEILKDLCDRYPALNDGKVLEDYPEWIIDDIRKTVIKESNSLHLNVVKANSIYPTPPYDMELHQRRAYINVSITSCEALIRVIDYASDIFPLNLNSLETLVKMLMKEVALLKHMRKTDARDYNEKKKRYALKINSSSNACNVNNEGNANNDDVTNSNGCRPRI